MGREILCFCTLWVRDLVRNLTASTQPSQRVCQSQSSKLEDPQLKNSKSSRKIFFSSPKSSTPTSKEDWRYDFFMNKFVAKKLLVHILLKRYLLWFILFQEVNKQTYKKAEFQRLCFCFHSFLDTVEGHFTLTNLISSQQKKRKSLPPKSCNEWFILDIPDKRQSG